MNQQLKTYLDSIAHKLTEDYQQLLDSPLIILSSPRSGSTLLMEILSKGSNIVTIGRESHVIYNEFEHLHAKFNNFKSAGLSATHADCKTKKYMRLMYFALLQNQHGKLLTNNDGVNKKGTLCFVEKTPRNALNIPFLLEIFPKAKFLVLHRKPEACISSLIEAWELGATSGQFVSYTNLPGWHLPYWSFLLPLNWQSMIDKPLVEIAVFQWISTYETIVKDLENVGKDKIYILRFEDLLRNTFNSIESIYHFNGMTVTKESNSEFKEPLKPSKSTLSKPAKDKWHRHKDIIDPFLKSINQTSQRIKEMSIL